MDDHDFRFAGGKHYARSTEFVYENRSNNICLVINDTGHRYMNRIEKSGLQAALFVDQYDQFTSAFGRAYCLTLLAILFSRASFKDGQKSGSLFMGFLSFTEDSKNSISSFVHA